MYIYGDLCQGSDEILFTNQTILLANLP